MPLMLLSNPGLPLALLGNPRRKGRKARKSVHRWAPRRVKRPAFLAAVRRAAKRVGKRYRHRGGKAGYRIETFRGVLRRRMRTHLPGVPWSGRKGYLAFTGRVRRTGERSYSRPHFLTNPRSSTMRRRRNPLSIAGYVSAAKAAPGQIKALFTGPNKVKNLAFAAGGAVGTYLVGGIVAAKVVAPLLARVPVLNRIVGSPMGARVVGGLMPFTIGYIASKFVKGDIGKALLVGGAAASLVELVKPGMVGQLVARIPGVPGVAAAVPAVAAPAIKGPTSGLNGLDGYVDAPSYAGVGDEDELAGYVDAQAYQAVGGADDVLAGPEDVLAGYVDAPSYAGVGEEMDGYIDQAQAGYQSFLAA